MEGSVADVAVSPQRTKAYVAGEWCSADSGKWYSVRDPASGTIISEVPRMGASETRRAIEAAESALGKWKRTPAPERSAILTEWARLVEEDLEPLAETLTNEQGKPLQEARNEIRQSIGLITWFAAEARRAYGDVIPSNAEGRHMMTVKEAVGVVGMITPWNYPSSMIARKLAPALAAGCTVVIKPASETPLSAFAIVRLAEKAGVPAGVVNVITGSASEIGAELTSNAIVRKLSFTGSTEVGKRLMKESAETLKRLSLELGGNAPLIIFADANIDGAVGQVMASKFRNGGQACVATNRVYVQRPIYNEFARLLVERTQSLRVGPGSSTETDVGPLINDTEVNRLDQLLRATVSSGASIACGGRKREGRYFDPTVMTNVTDDMNISQEELFGPVAALYPFDTEDEVIARANDTTYGLAAYFFTRDLDRAWRVSQALDYGMVGINEGLIANEAAPFGGIKESGFGREGGNLGIEEYLNVKYVCFGKSS